MNKRAGRTNLRANHIAIAVAAAFAPWSLHAQTPPAPNTLPTGGVITHGSGTINAPVQAGTVSTMQIDQTSARMAAQFGSFSIGQSAHVNVTQPSSSSIALFKDVGGSVSQIFGHLTANGQLFVSNPDGVLIGRTGRVEAAGFIATTLSLDANEFMLGGNTFNWLNIGARGRITNEGTIFTPNGYAMLAGPQVLNDGLIIANRGSVVLAAGDRVSLDLVGDGLISVSVDQAALNASAINTGTIEAEGGKVVLTARSANALLDTVVNAGGVIRANALVERNGEIVLDGGGAVQVAGTVEAIGGAIHMSADTSLNIGSTVCCVPTQVTAGTQTLEAGSITVGGGASVTTTSGSQTVTTPGTLLVRGGVLSGGVGLFHNGSGEQRISAGNLELRGGSGTNTGAFINSNAGGDQVVTVSGALTITGGASGTGNRAGLVSTGAQTINGNPDIVLTGGSGGGSGNASNNVFIQATGPDTKPQTINARSIRLNAGTGTDASATLNAARQVINTIGDVSLVGGAGPGGSNGVRIGGIGGTTLGPTNLTLNVGGNLLLHGGSVNGASLGSSGASTQANTITVNATGNIALESEGAGARIGSSNQAGATPGNISVTAGGSLELDTGTAVRANGPITLTADSLSNDGAITNGGGANTPNIILSANAFDLVGGNVQGGAAAVILRPRTGTNSFGIEAAGDTTVTNADIGSINTSNFVVFGSGTGTIFTGNMTIGQNAQVDGGTKNLAFFRSSAPGGTTTIGSQGVTTSGDAIVSAGGGAIVSNGGMVSADEVQLRASQGIGSATARVQTNANALAINNTGSQGAFVSEADNVTLRNVNMVVGGNVNNVANFVGAGGAYDVAANGALTVGGPISTLNGAITLNAGSLTNNSLITNGGAASNANMILSANAFDLADGNIQGGAAAVILRPRTGTNSFGIEAAADTTLTNADIGSINTSNFVVFGSGTGTIFTGNMNIGENARVEGGTKNLAFFRSSMPGGTTTIGAQGVSSSGNVIVSAGGGAILSNGGTVAGDQVQLRASQGIGSAAARVQTAANRLALNNTGSQGAFVFEAGDVTLGNVNLTVGGNVNNVANVIGGGGAYDVTAGGSITVSDLVQAGSVTLATPSGSIVELGAGAIQANTLTTSSAHQTSLTGANQVANFNGSTAFGALSGDITLNNTGALTVTGLSAGNNATLTNNGAVSVSGGWFSFGETDIATTSGNLAVTSSLSSTRAMELDVGGTLTVSANGPQTAQVITNNGGQTIRAQAVEVVAQNGGFAGITNIAGGEQRITVSGVGASPGLDVHTRPSGGRAEIFQQAGGFAQTIEVTNADHINVNGAGPSPFGGSGAAISSIGGTQTISITGSGANAITLGSQGALGDSRIGGGQHQIVTAGAAGEHGSITIVGPDANTRLAGFVSTPVGLGGTQTVSTTGTLRVQGGRASQLSNFQSGVFHNGSGAQTVNAGRIELQGGSTGFNNGAFISGGNPTVHLGNQFITVSGDIVIAAGAGGAASIAGGLPSTLQVIHAHNIDLSNAVGGTNSFASIRGGKQEIHATGDVTLRAFATNGTDGGVRIGGLTPNATDLDLYVGRDLILTGGSAADNNANIGSAGSAGVFNRIHIEAGRDVVLNSGSGSGARIGSGNTLGDGNIEIHAGRNIELNGIARPTSIRTLGSVILEAASITEASNGSIIAGSLTTSTSGATNLAGPNEISRFSATSGGPLVLVDAGGLQVTGITTTDDTITLTTDSLTNSGTITNGGGTGTANVILNADAFNLTGGTIQGGAAAVVLRPRTGTNSFGIEAAGATTLTNADIASIQTDNFIIFGSSTGTTFTGNMTIGENARVEGNGKNLAFSRSLTPGAEMITIGSQGVATTGDIIIGAGGGGIRTNGGTITGDEVVLRATNGIGTPSARVKTAANALALNNAGGGGVFVSELDNVTLRTISLNAGGPFTVSNTNSGSFSLISGGDVNVAGLVSSAGSMLLDAGGNLKLDGSVVDAVLMSNGGQTITARSIDLTAQNGRRANIENTNGHQSVSATAGDMNLQVPGGFGVAQIINTAPGGNQTVRASGQLNVLGGVITPTTSRNSGIFKNGPGGLQTVSASGITLQGASTGTSAGALIASQGDQFVDVTGGNINVFGGNGGNINNAAILASASGQQTIRAHDINLGNGFGGTDTVAAIQAGHQDIHATGNVTLTAQGALLGTAAGGPGVRIGAPQNTAAGSDVTLRVGGNLTINGGTMAENGASIGSSAAGTAAPNKITIDAGGSVMLNAGAEPGTGVRIGSGSNGTASGDISIKAGGTIAMNGTARSAAIRTLDDVTLDAASISQGSNGFILADTLTTRTTGATNLTGPNEINAFNATSGGALTVVDAGALNVTGISTTNDTITLTTDSLSNVGVITNGGPSSTANVVLNADAFNLAAGTVEGGAAAVIVRPKTGTNSFGIESAGATTITNADLASINTSDFVVFGSGVGTTFTGNMTIGQNAQVNGGGKNLAFFRSSVPGGTTTIGGAGVSTMGNVIVSAGGGSIVSNGGTVSGDQVQLRASQGIGSATARVQTNANALVINNTGSQGAFVSEADNVTLRTISLNVGGNLNTASNTNNGSVSLISGGDVNVAGLVSSAGSMVLDAGGNLKLDGSVVDAVLMSNGGQSITARSIDLTAQNGRRANIENTNGNQSVIATGGGMNLQVPGGFGVAQIINTATGGNQTVAMTGQLNVLGGVISPTTSRNSGIFKNGAGGMQSVSASGITLQGASSGTSAGALIASQADQSINVAGGDINLIGGSGGTGNNAQIAAGLTGQQTIVARNIDLRNGFGGTDTVAGLFGGRQTIDATGNVTLTSQGALVGTAPGGPGVRIGAGAASTAGTDLTLLVGGNLVLNGGSAVDNGASIGSSGAAAIPAPNAIRIEAGGSVILNGGTLAGTGARIGSSAQNGAASGNLAIKAGGSIELNGTVPGAGTAIRTLGDVTLQAASISEASNGFVVANALTTTTSGNTSLTGPNQIASFNATSTGGDVSLRNTGVLDVTGMNAFGDATINNIGDVTVSGPWTAGGTSTISVGSDIVLNARMESRDVVLNANDGAIIQAPTASIVADSLTTTSTGDTLLDGLNQVETISVSSTAGDVRLTTSSPVLTIASIDLPGELLVRHTGAVNVRGEVSALAHDISATGDVTVGSADAQSATLLYAPGDISISTPGSILVRGSDTTAGASSAVLADGQLRFNAGNVTLRAGDAALTPVVVRGANGVQMTVGNELKVTGGRGLLSPALLSSGRDIALTVGGAMRIDGGSGFLSIARVQTETVEGQIRITFPNLSDGGYFVNGLEGHRHNHDSGFYSMLKPAKVGKTLLLEYAD